MDDDEAWRLTVSHAVEQARARSAQLQGRRGPISNRGRISQIQSLHTTRCKRKEVEGSPRSGANGRKIDRDRHRGFRRRSVGSRSIVWSATLHRRRGLDLPFEWGSRQLQSVPRQFNDALPARSALASFSTRKAGDPALAVMRLRMSPIA
jgi:hypothetical protein